MEVYRHLALRIRIKKFLKELLVTKVSSLNIIANKGQQTYFGQSRTKY